MRKIITFVIFLSFNLLAAGFDYMNISFDPRIGGTGDVMIETPYLFSSNPAAIVLDTPSYLSFVYLHHWADISIGDIAYVKDYTSFIGGFDLFYMTTGKIKKTSPENEELGTYSANFFSLGGSFKKSIKDGINVGGRLRLHAGFVDTVYNFAFSLDAGAIVKPLENLLFSLNIRNIGYEIIPFVKERDLMPGGGEIKVSYFLGSVMVGVGGSYDLNWGFRFGTGVEILPNNFMRVRFGYNSMGKDQIIEGSEVFSGISFGMGIIDIKRVSIDYSTSYFSYLGFSHRLGFVYKFE